MLQVLTRTDFVTWLRTGRRPVPDEIELKFNPWHDPRDGRFTFVGSGRFYGWMQGGFTGGGGGSAGGGGASGSWEAPAPKSRAGPRTRGAVSGGRARSTPVGRAARPERRPDAQPVSVARLPIDLRALAEPGPMWEEVSRKGYRFRLDARVARCTPQGR